jgi:hypothetical protein
MDIDPNQLPIPDWGLECPRCRYLLKGLPTHRCPECGTEVHVPSLIRPWTPLRPPRFSGNELPLPDFGLTCDACGGPLVGAATHACVYCGEPFDPQALRPPGKWFILRAETCAGLAMPAVQKSAFEILGGYSILFTRFRIPTEFYFEVLWLLQRTRQELAEARRPRRAKPWTCPGCGQRNPGNFEICWNCEGVRNSE